MTSGPALSDTQTPAGYCRQARRIRCAFARDPRRRVHALRELAHRHDAARWATVRPLTPAPVPSAAWFAQLVRARIDGPVLRYSQRTRLLREATRRGIGRFEANLIIAAVQHQAGEKRQAELVSTRSTWIVIVIGFVVTQGAVVTALWHLIR